MTEFFMLGVKAGAILLGFVGIIAAALAALWLLTLLGVVMSEKIGGPR